MSRRVITCPHCGARVRVRIVDVRLDESVQSHELRGLTRRVLKCLEEDPGRLWTIDMLQAVLEPETPRRIGNALTRLRDRGEAVDVSRGVWRRT